MSTWDKFAYLGSFSGNVLRGDFADDYYDNRGPIIEFPPTLPRDAAPPPPHHYYGGSSSMAGQNSRSLRKSRSFADWQEPRAEEAPLMR